MKGNLIQNISYDMKDLTLFILTVNNEKSDVKKTIDSFGDLIAASIFIDNLCGLNKVKKLTDWYGIMYDDEWIQDELKVALPIFFKECKADAFVIYKKIGKRMYLCPRFYRKNVKLMEGSPIPEPSVTQIETILNGWVFST